MKQRLNELLAEWLEMVEETKAEMKRVGKYNFKYDTMDERVWTLKLCIAQLKNLIKKTKD